MDAVDQMSDTDVADYPSGLARAPLGGALVLAESAGLIASPTGASPRAAREATGHAAAVLRRAFDVVVAALVLLLLLPLLLVIAALIKLDTPGSIFFRQRRLGRDMRPFTVLKLRTMRTDATSDTHIQYIAAAVKSRNSDDGSPLKKLTDDPRVTRVGRTLRRLSIDEIPQLFNVLAGHMALVGPRPALEYELEHYDPVHYERFNVRPGITGLWQVSGRSALSFTDMLDLDVRYATQAPFGADLRILARTPFAAVRNAA